MNHTTINGKQVVLSRKKENDFDSQANLIIMNLAEEMTQSKLNEVFAEFGKIVSCKIETTPDNKCRGFGYVQFEKQE